MFGAGFGGMDGFEGTPFASMFGGAESFFGGRSRGPRRGKDSIGRIPVTLEQMYNGYTKELDLEKCIVCPTCSGLGGKDGASHQCGVCRGRGMKVEMRQIGRGMVQQISSVCDVCNGTGNTMAEEDKCGRCKGKKTINKERKLKVRIEPGMPDGHKIYFRGEGDQEPGVEPGDVIIQIMEEKHDVFRRDHMDLHVTKDIGLTEALCGGKFLIKHLDDRDLLVTLPAGDRINNGDVRAIYGEGMPLHGRPNERGNLYVKLNIDFPNDNFLPEAKLLDLEKFLGGPSKFKRPVGDDVEEVNMVDYEDTNAGADFDKDDSDNEGAEGPRMQCAHQ